MYLKSMLKLTSIPFTCLLSSYVTQTNIIQSPVFWSVNWMATWITNHLVIRLLWAIRLPDVSDNGMPTVSQNLSCLAFLVVTFVGLLSGVEFFWEIFANFNLWGTVWNNLFKGNARHLLNKKKVKFHEWGSEDRKDY